MLHPFLVLLTCGVVTATSVNLASGQQVLYTAQASLVVGRIDVPGNAVPGYAQATNTLAGTYSRFVGSDTHLEEMAFLTGVEPAELQRLGDIEASNIEQSAIILVRAHSVDEQNALQLADIASAALVRVVTGVNNPSIDGDALFAEHSEAALSLATSQADVDELQRDLSFFLGADPVNDVPGLPTAAQSAIETENELLNARADFNQQQLRVATLATLYLESQRPRADGELIRTLTGAKSVGDNSSANVRLGTIVGVVGGLALGVGLAWLATNIPALLAWRRELKARVDLSAQDGARTNGSRPPGRNRIERRHSAHAAVNGTSSGHDSASEHDASAT